MNKYAIIMIILFIVGCEQSESATKQNYTDEILLSLYEDTLDRQTYLREEVLKIAFKFEESAREFDELANFLENEAINTTDKNTANSLRERAQIARDNAQADRNSANNGTKPEE